MKREIKERAILDRFAVDFGEIVEKHHQDKSANPKVTVIMRDMTHSEQVIRWAEYVKSHPAHCG